ncbi:MAG: hypothetical protein LC658_02650, partial [Bacteroidales bacterium]|nr:hypothetical protein [Bacteroidales bacterium]
MRKIKVLFIFAFSFYLSLSLNAQKTAYYGDVSEDVQMARDLYQQGKYNAAYRQFEKVQKQVDPKSELFSEALYFRAVSAMKAGHNSGSRMLEGF